MSNPFADQKWETSGIAGDILPEGNHLVTIDSIDDTETSSGGHPQLIIKASNDQGAITDWRVVTASAIRFVTNFFAACDLEPPEEDQVTEEGTGYRIDRKYIDQCVDKKVGVIVRLEADRNDPTKMRSKVKGWVKPEELTDIPVSSDFDKAPGSADSSDIPF